MLLFIATRSTAMETVLTISVLQWSWPSLCWPTNQMRHYDIEYLIKDTFVMSNPILLTSYPIIWREQFCAGQHLAYLASPSEPQSHILQLLVKQLLLAGPLLLFVVRTHVRTLFLHPFGRELYDTFNDPSPTDSELRNHHSSWLTTDKDPYADPTLFRLTDPCSSLPGISNK